MQCEGRLGQKLEYSRKEGEKSGCMITQTLLPRHKQYRNSLERPNRIRATLQGDNPYLGDVRLQYYVEYIPTERSVRR